MGIETERKFLVTSSEWRKMGTPVAIRQGFLSLTGNSRIRVRIYGDCGFITVKGKSFDGISRVEYEYPIPVTDAEDMLKTLAIRPIIVKNRTKIPYKGHIIEVDEFFEENSGLVVAEIELQSPDEPFERPPWLGREVTFFRRYSNARLAVHSYKDWSEDEKAGL